MGIPVKLQVFEGPLDLLLHLIDKNKVDIYDIPIVEITRQYMDYIREMQQEDLNIVSEFMVMAATLIQIKCKMLLPKEINEVGEEKDPREELVQQLLEYKMYKYMSYELREKMAQASRCVFKPSTYPKEVLDYREPVNLEELIGDLNLAKLKQIYRAVMRRREDKHEPKPEENKIGKIEKEEVNLEEKTEELEEFFRYHKSVTFRNLLEKQPSKMEIIVTFLVVLELMKVGMIEICQEELFEDIQITSLVYGKSESA